MAYNSRTCRWCVALAQWWQGDVSGAIPQFRDLVAESEAAHDEMWRAASLVSLGHVLVYGGDATGARAAATAAVDGAADFGEFAKGLPARRWPPRPWPQVTWRRRPAPPRRLGN